MTKGIRLENVFQTVQADGDVLHVLVNNGGRNRTALFLGVEDVEGGDVSAVRASQQAVGVELNGLFGLADQGGDGVEFR